MKRDAPPAPSSIVFVPPVDRDDVPILGLRRDAAAKSLDISPRKLDELRAGGAVPFVKIDGTVIFPVEGLLRWLRDRSKGGE